MARAAVKATTTRPRKATATRPRKAAPANRGHGEKGVARYDPDKHPRGPDGRFLSKGGPAAKAPKTGTKAARAPAKPKPPRKVGTPKQRKGLADQIRAARAAATTPAARKALLGQVRDLRRKRAEWQRGQGKTQVEKLPKPPKVKTPKVAKEKAPKKEKPAAIKPAAKPKSEKPSKPAKEPKKPAAAKSAGTNFGPSKATVKTTPDLSPAEAKAQLDKARRILGPHATEQDIASITGAPNDARVHLADAIFSPQNSIAMYVKSSNVQALRRITREPGGDLVITNEMFKVEGTGAGAGSRIFGRQVEQAARLGATKIDTMAARGPGLNGYITWPKLGYDAPIPVSVRGKLTPELKSAKNLSDLMKTEAGTQWWTTHGISTQMAFDLKAGSYSRTHLAKYLEKKGITE